MYPHHPLPSRAAAFSCPVTIHGFLPLLPLLLLALLLSTAAHAGITLDGSLGPAKSLPGPDFVIDAVDGTLIDRLSLFHSFGRFDIAAGESATFTGPDGINTIIGRITGGDLSTIDGTLRSAIPGADLFLVNPAGLLFGPHAALDVQGSFHVTTADYLRLGETGIVYADPAGNSVLTIAPPAAFGFLGNHPAAISIQQSGLLVPAGETLSLVGGNIDISGSETAGLAFVAAPGGRINLLSTASPGEIKIAAADMPLGIDPAGFTALGDIHLTLAAIDAEGNGGGTVVVRGGRLEMLAAYIDSSALGPQGAASPGRGIDIETGGDITLDIFSCIASGVSFGVAADAGGIRVTADSVSVRGESRIMSVTWEGTETTPVSTGSSGDIELSANHLLLDGFGAIYTFSGGNEASGDIHITAGNLEICNGGKIASQLYGGASGGGDIEINAGRIFLANEEQPGYHTGISSVNDVPATGKTGDIDIRADSVEMRPDTMITADTFADGPGGDIHLDITGDLLITGTEREATETAYIATGIVSHTFSSAAGGDVTIAAGNLAIHHLGGIQSTTSSTGNAGMTSITVDSLELTDGAMITATNYAGTGGRGGDINLTAKDISLRGPEGALISTSSSPLSGDGGNIHIDTDTLLLTDRSTIEALSRGPGQGGDITIAAGTIDILNGANVNSSALGRGAGGSIVIAADNILVAGVHPEKMLDPAGGETLSASSIASQALQSGGNGGSITIRAESLRVLDSGSITTDTFGGGTAGDIDIRAGNMLVSGTNTDLRDLFILHGWNIRNAAAAISAAASSDILGDLATGDGGRIDIDAGDMTLRDGGRITSSTTSPGTGGEITAHVDTLELSERAYISSESLGTGDAGNISLAATNAVRLHESSISTASWYADGGNITVSGPRHLLHLVDSDISASVGGGAATVGGNIDISPAYLVLNNSIIIANAWEGTGGNISIAADVFLADPLSVLDASSALGVDGSVDIQSPITSVSGTIAPLPGDFTSAVTLLQTPCMARIQQGRYSSFTVHGREGLPAGPDGFLSSPLMNSGASRPSSQSNDSRR
ncbi:MAG: filamentous hemagglutinin N-terminal domain-containing protein [Deltaproteobacteria bacterium]|nr:filamentous hemagglutinin N-terminal domain-containing protein [Candidatus Anaeroferrophillacea bacterium]